MFGKGKKMISTIIWLIKWPFAKAREIIEYGIRSMKDGKQGFLSFIKLLPGITIILSAGMAIYCFATFMITTGYGSQLKTLHEEGVLGGAEFTDTVSPFYNNQNWLALFILFEIIGCIIAASGKSSKGEGRVLLGYSVISWFYYYMLMPGLTFLITNGPALGSNLLKIVVVLIICAVVFAILAGAGSGGGGSTAERNAGIDRDIAKKKQQYDNMKKKRDDYAYYNKRQAEGAWGYQYHSAELNREVIRDTEKQMEYLEKDIEKLEKKKK